jgi:uncharacterized protein (TIGR03000 family)
MFRPWISRLIWGFAGALLLTAPLQAQPPGQGLGRGPYTSRGPVVYGPLTFYGAPATEIDSPLRRAGDNGGSVSYYTSADSPIFLTSINFPGVYGSHTIGVAARNYKPSTRLTYYPPAEGLVLRDPNPSVLNRTSVERVRPVNVATLTIRVPTDDTELYLQDTRMTKTGTVRDFVTQPLLTSRDYTYDIRAAWDDKNGRSHVSERHLTVRAGDKIDVDMTGRPSEPPPEEPKQRTLRTSPLPIRPGR